MSEDQLMYPDFETERLLLKGISHEDRKFLLQQFSDDDVNQYLYDAEPFQTIEEADELIDFYINTKPKLQHRWILTLKDSGEKIGTCGFHCWDQQNKSVEIGYDLQKKYWGQGYMSEAVRPIIEFLERNLDVKQMDAHISIDNENSIRFAENLGFQFHGKQFSCVFRGKNYLHRVFTLDLT